MRAHLVPAGGRRRPEALETGPRVFLRTPKRRDAPALAALARASRRLHRPWVYPPESVPAATRWIKGAGSTRRRLLVCRRADAAIAGVVNLNEVVRGAFQSAYLGYYAFRPHAGQGLMTEGLALVLRHAFRRLGLHRLEANVQPGNRSSQALLRRLGFRREGFSPRYLKVGGRWRGWAILREGWTAGRTASARSQRVPRPVRAPLPRNPRNRS